MLWILLRSTIHRTRHLLMRILLINSWRWHVGITVRIVMRVTVRILMRIVVRILMRIIAMHRWSGWESVWRRGRHVSHLVHHGLIMRIVSVVVFVVLTLMVFMVAECSKTTSTTTQQTADDREP